MTKKVKVACAVMAFVFLAAPVWAAAIQPGQPGDNVPGLSDLFSFMFDENSADLISIDDGPFTTLAGSLRPDPSNGGVMALTYFLPAGQAPVVNGDVLSWPVLIRRHCPMSCALRMRTAD